MTAPAGTHRLLLRPVGGVQPDGAQLFDVWEPDPPVWVSTASYPAGAHVTGSDSKIYLAKVASKGINPVGDAAVHWLNLW